MVKLDLPEVPDKSILDISEDTYISLIDKGIHSLDDLLRAQAKESFAGYDDMFDELVRKLRKIEGVDVEVLDSTESHKNNALGLLISSKDYKIKLSSDIKINSEEAKQIQKILDDHSLALSRYNPSGMDLLKSIGKARDRFFDRALDLTLIQEIVPADYSRNISALFCPRVNGVYGGVFDARAVLIGMPLQKAEKWNQFLDEDYTSDNLRESIPEKVKGMNLDSKIYNTFIVSNPCKNLDSNLIYHEGARMVLVNYAECLERNLRESFKTLFGEDLSEFQGDEWSEKQE